MEKLHFNKSVFSFIKKIQIVKTYEVQGFFLCARSSVGTEIPDDINYWSQTKTQWHTSSNDFHTQKTKTVCTSKVAGCVITWSSERKNPNKYNFKCHVKAEKSNKTTSLLSFFAKTYDLYIRIMHWKKEKTNNDILNFTCFLFNCLSWAQ